MAAGVGLVLAGVVQPGDRADETPPPLETAGEFDTSLSRAEVRTPLYAMPEDQNQVALEIKVDNEQWAQDCAAYYHFHIEEFAE